MRTATLSVLALSAALSGCQGPDVGQACSLQTGQGAAPVTADFFESNPSNGCDALICIESPAQTSSSKVKNNPYCSKACKSNSDCFQGDTGLVCRPVTVDLDYVNSLAKSQRDTYYRIAGCQIPDSGTQDTGSSDPCCSDISQVCGTAAPLKCHGVTPVCPLLFSAYCAAPLQ